MLLTEQFIGGLNYKGMTDEILREATTLENIEKAPGLVSFKLGMQSKGAKVQRSALNGIKEAKDFDAIQQNAQKHVSETLCSDKCEYFGKGIFPSSALHTERNMGNTAKTTTSRQSADICRDNR